MLEEAEELAEDGMKEALDRLRKRLANVRAGRANPKILDAVQVESYGTKMALNQVAVISVADARLLVVKPFDRNTISAIEKAINSAALGLNCNNDGVVVRVPVPPLTEERRRDLVRQVKQYVEDAKVACRQARREANDLLKQAEKDKEISEDDLKKGLSSIQDLTNKYVKTSDGILTKKTEEIMEV